MRRRPSARLLLLDEQNRVLLFRFVFKRGTVIEQDFWATTGGGLEEGETFVQAAHRELLEETGIAVESIGKPVAEKEFIFNIAPTGEQVLAQEQYFIVRVSHQTLSKEGWTILEKEFMTEHRWWSAQELEETTDLFYPKDLPEILKRNF